MKSDLQNLRRMMRARRDFRAFLYRVDGAFRRSLQIALVGLLVSILSLVLVFVPELQVNWLLVSSLALGVVALAISAWGILDAYAKIHAYEPVQEDYEYFAVQHPDIPVHSRRKYMKISELMPCRTERELGFRSVEPLGTDEVAMASDEVDDWLSTQPKLPIDLRESAVGLFGWQPDAQEYLRHRIAYLRSLVLRMHTVNEPKYRIDHIPNPRTRLVGVRKVSYFDAMATNQALSLELRERPSGTMQQGEPVKDFRHAFPCIIEGSESEPVHCLAAFDDSFSLANSVGVSTLVVTRDRFPVFFHQKSINVEGGGKLTVLASGSADFADIARAGGNDFLEVLRYGMVREAMEEGLLKERSDAASLMAKAVSQTMILGFFRWVRRAGKPEFVGVTRLDVGLKEIRPDGKEVARLQQNAPIALSRMSDFDRLVGLLGDARSGARQKDKFWLGLSSAMVLHRLSRIANARSEAELAIKARVARLIDIAMD